jgi:hypothetical protein
MAFLSDQSMLDKAGKPGFYFVYGNSGSWNIYQRLPEKTLSAFIGLIMGQLFYIFNLILGLVRLYCTRKLR